jgi:hypothetical protein
VCRRDTSGEHDSITLEHGHKATPCDGSKAVVWETRKVNNHAITSSSRSFDSSRCLAVAGKPLHSHAAFHQVDFEWRGCDCHCSMAAQCFWPFAFSVPDAHWIVTGKQKRGHNFNSNEIRQTFCLKEIF